MTPFQKIQKLLGSLLLPGIQISGIRSEDFISSNIAPAFQANIGKWFTPEIALQIGYKGSFFRTISNADRHYYDYYYGEVRSTRRLIR